MTKREKKMAEKSERLDVVDGRERLHGFFRFFLPSQDRAISRFDSAPSPLDAPNTDRSALSGDVSDQKSIIKDS